MTNNLVFIFVFFSFGAMADQGFVVIDEVGDEFQEESLPMSMRRRYRCPVTPCVWVGQKIRKHLLHNHFPAFMKKESSEPIEPSYFVEFLVKIQNHLGLDTLEGLLDYVLEHHLYPPPPCEFRAADKLDCELLAELLEDTMEDVTLSPPNCVTSFLHWRILGPLLGRLTQEQRKDMREFIPWRTICPVKNKGSSSSDHVEAPLHKKKRGESSGSGHGAKRSDSTSSVLAVKVSDNGQRAVTAVRSSMDKPAADLPLGFDSHFHLDLLLQRCHAQT